jgi:hypothetical protein
MEPLAADSRAGIREKAPEIQVGVILAPLAIELPEKSYQIRVNANGSAEPAIAYASPPTGFLLSRG